MQISLLAVIALLGLAAAAPSTSKRDHWKQKYDVGCVGKGGGDGAECHVLVGYGDVYCPVNCKNKDYCP
ncbi:hypothetical protein N7453_006029 [Penicillium expansum]|nr:hypothetical protein N7453_006029 [Penicillium expansum]